MSVHLLLAGALATGLSAGAASAAAVSAASASASLTLVSTTGEVVVTGIEPVIDFDAARLGDAAADASADAVLGGPPLTLTYSAALSASSGDPLSADPFPFGSAFASAFGPAVEVSNPGSGAGSATFSLAYDLAVSAAGDTDLDEAIGTATLLVSSGTFPEYEEVFYGEVLANSLFDLPEDRATGTLKFTLDVGPGGQRVIDVLFVANASAASYAPAVIPLPAAGWLMAGSLAALGLLRRRDRWLSRAGRGSGRDRDGRRPG